MKLAGILFLVVINIFSILDLSGQCITLTSGNNNQTVCVNSPIVDIVYTVAIGVTDVLSSNLPAGITGKLTGTTYTLSGSQIGRAHV